MNVSGVHKTIFAVDDVRPATMSRPELPYAEAIAQALQRGEVQDAALESWSQNDKMLLTPFFNTHSFLRAMNLAFALHHPMVMSPDMIWFLILRGLTKHIHLHAESLRPRFVAHEGKARLAVIRDEFIRGFAGNDWEGAFGEFSTQIKAHVGERTHGLVVQQFSTTGIVEKAAMEITLMDAMQFYFDYRLLTRCGIPSITLEGTADDWEKVRAGAQQLAQFDLHWWTRHLLPVLEQFVQASRGQVDRTFWQGFFKRGDSSGGPYINGHIVNFFPYLVAPDKKTRRNPFLGYAGGIRNDHASLQEMRGMTTGQVPGGLAIAPFTWQFLHAKVPMELVAGFVGVAQDKETLALRPEIGWAVRQRVGEAAGGVV